VPEELKTTMAIYDRQSYNEVAFNADAVDTYVEYYFEPSDVQRAIARFETLLTTAKPDIPEELKEVAKIAGEEAQPRWRRLFRRRKT
jgi:hypothetical protein